MTIVPPKGETAFVSELANMPAPSMAFAIGSQRLTSGSAGQRRVDRMRRYARRLEGARWLGFCYDNAYPQRWMLGVPPPTDGDSLAFGPGFLWVYED